MVKIGRLFSYVEQFACEENMLRIVQLDGVLASHIRVTGGSMQATDKGILVNHIYIVKVLVLQKNVLHWFHVNTNTKI